MNAIKNYNKSRCEKCREKMEQEAARQITEQTLDNEYKYFQEFQKTSGESLRNVDFTLIFGAMVSECIDKETIQRVFEKAVMFTQVSQMFGKKITMEEMLTTLQNEYGLDFDRIQYNCESLEDFKKRYWDEFPIEENYNVSYKI